MNIETEYQSALNYLYSFVDYSLTRAFRYSPEKFDLGRMANLLEKLGNPERKYPVIHLAGTKGKGSTAAMIASVLRASGYRTGFYTSPHLQDFTERIQVNGQRISHASIVRLVERIKPYANQIQQITTFELTTALAFDYFAEQQVDVAVVEVGLGGRLDATNLVDPLVSVVTSISYDHMAVLGNTLSKIAFEKGGIIKPGKPVVLAPQKEEALRILVQIAQERKAPVIKVGEDFRYAPLVHTLEGQSIWIWKADEQSKMDLYIEGENTFGWQPVEIFVPLLGLHQVENAATAYAALCAAVEQGLHISEEAIYKGFRQVFWPGRFEVLRRAPPLIVDSAHNRDSALKLRIAIDDYLSEWPVLLLFGASEDKDIEGMFAELLPRVERLIVTESFHPRALRAERLVELAHRFGRSAQKVLPIEDALEKALELAGSQTAIVVAGSLFVAAAARETWHRMGQPLRVFETAEL